MDNNAESTTELNSAGGGGRLLDAILEHNSKGEFPCKQKQVIG